MCLETSQENTEKISKNQTKEIRKTYKSNTVIPEISVEVTENGSKYNGNWTSGDIVLTPEFEGNANVTAYQYKTNGSTTWSGTTTNNITISSNYNNQIVVQGINPAGNAVTAEYTTNKIKIDKIAPQIKSVTYENIERTIALEIKASDDLSGLKDYAITQSETETKEWRNIINTETGIINTDVGGTGTYYIWVKDNAGNISNAKTISVSKDIEPPTGTISVKEAYLKEGKNEYVNNINLTLQITVQDNISSSSEIQMALYTESAYQALTDESEITWKAYQAENAWTLTNENMNETVYLILKDKAGNISKGIGIVSPGMVTYEVYHYVENENDTNYTLYREETKAGTAKRTITLENERIKENGITYNKGSLTQNGTAVTTTTLKTDGTTKIYLYYTRNTYTLTFNTNGGSSIASITKKAGTEVTKPADPTKKGYEFDGWTPEVPSIMPGENVEYVAKWKLKEYTITYNLQGGEFKNTYPTSYNITSSDITLVAPEKTGYEFAGWTGEDLVEPTINVTIPQGSTGDKTYTATWGYKVYTVTYNANGGTIKGTTNETTTKTVTYSGTYGANGMPEATASGYTFKGWYTEKTAGTQITNSTIVTETAENQTLYAHWEGAIALYSESEKSLTFYRANQIVKAGDTYDNKVATAVYTGIEEDNYSSTSGYEPWYEYRTNIKTVSFENEISPKYTKYWFYGLTEATTIDVTNLNTSNVTLMQYMFKNCSSLTTLDLSNFNTSKVTSMNSIFYGCSSLTKLDLSNFNTSSVTSMMCMFEGCSSLKELKLSNFNTSNVINMNGMFSNCSSLTSLDVSSFDTSNVEYINNMFSDCSSLTTLDVSSFNTKNVTTMGNMFSNATNLKSLKLGSNFNTSKVTSMGYMFSNCSSLAEVNVSSFDTSNVTSMNGMFYNCSSLISLDLSNFDTKKVKGMKSMFRGCKSLTTLKLSSKFDTSKVTSMWEMFCVCSSLTNLDLSSFNTSSVTDMSYMFSGCSSLTKLDLSGFNTKNVTNMSYFFDRMYKLQEITLGSAFSFSGDGSTSCTLPEPKSTNITGADGKWYDKETGDEYAPSEVPITREKTTTYTAIRPNPTAYAIYSADDNSLTFYKNINTVTAGEMYNGKTATAVYTGIEEDTYAAATKVPWYSYRTNIKTVSFENEMSPASIAYWFYGFTNATAMNLANLKTEKVTNMDSMFSGCSSLNKLDLSNFDTSNVTNMHGMFYNCSKLAELIISGFITTNVTTTRSMFGGCSSLTALDVSSFKTQNVTDMKGMFWNCSLLSTLDLSKFNTPKVETMENMFSDCSNITKLDLSNFSTSSVTNMSNMFTRMTKLQEITLGSAFSFNGSGSTRLCSLPEPKSTNITGADGKWYNKTTGEAFAPSEVPNTTAATYVAVNPNKAFAVYSADNSSLTFYKNPDTVTVGDVYKNETVTAVYTGIETSKYDSDSSVPWESYKSNITTVTFYSGDKEKVSPKSTAYWFDGFTNLTTINNLTNLNTLNVTNMFRMFYNCSKLTTLDVSNFNTSNVTNMAYMFESCTNVTTLDVSNFNTSKVKIMSNMFYNCSSLTTLDVSKFNTSNVTNMYQMFYNCSKLTTLDVSNFDTSNVTTMQQMFYYCLSLKELNLSNFNTSNVTSMFHMFDNCSKLTTLDVSNFNTSNVTNMEGMFYNCSSLTALDVSKFNTSNVKNMAGMFSNCSKLTTLDVSNFDTSNVTTMSAMFENCSKLTELDVSDFNTSKVTSMKKMFCGCSSLTAITFGDNFNTVSVTEMSYMFSNCSNIIILNLSKFDLSNIKNMACMFDHCSKLTELNLGSSSTPNLENVSNMFNGCSSLTVLDLSSFNTENLTNMNSIFWNCSSLTTLNLSSFDTSKVTSMSNPFYGMTKLQEITLGSAFSFSGDGSTSCTLPKPSSSYITDANGKWYNTETGIGYAPSEVPNNTAATYTAIAPKVAFAVYSETDNSLTFYKNSDLVNPGDTYNDKTVTAVYTGIETTNYTDLKDRPKYNTNTTTVTFENEISPVSTAYWFYQCEKLTTIKNITNLNTSNVTNMSCMFYQCENLTTPDVSNFNTSKVTDMSGMFCNCSGLTKLDLSNFDTSNVTSMGAMFTNCSKLTTLDVSNFNTSKVTNMVEMFDSCSNLTTLKLSNNFDTSNVTSMKCMFYNCSKLTELNLSCFNTGNVTNMYQMFYNCSKLITLDVSKFDTSKVTNMYRMFYNCSKLTTLNLSNFNTSKVTNMYYMFGYCSELIELDLSNFITSEVTNMQGMFDTCEKLTKLDISKFNTSKVTQMNRMFAICRSLTNLNLSSFDTSSVTGMTNMFAGLATLQEITLGSAFSFNGSGSTRLCSLPEPSTGSEGNWYNKETGESYTPETVPNNIAATYVAINPKTEFVVYSADDNSLTFYKNIDGAELVEGTTYKGKTVSFICQDSFESNLYASSEIPWQSIAGNVTKVVFNGKIAPASTAYWFKGFDRLTEIENLEKLDTSNVTDMRGMFHNCSSLTTLDLSNFDTSNVSSTTNMFVGMNKLQEITLGANFNFINTDDASCTLPAPNSSYITGADGKWYNKDTGTAYTPANVPSNIAATYSAIPVYVVTFNANGGQIDDLGASTTTRRVTFGKTYNEGSDTLPSAVSGEEYEFLGWNTKQDGTGTTITGSTVVDATASGLTLYAKWKKAGEAFAVYSADDNSLTFYKNKDTITEGETYNGKTATAVYTGVENTNYTSSSDVAWSAYANDIITVEVTTEIAPISTAYWFYGFVSATSIDVAKINTSNVTDMSYMFYMPTVLSGTNGGLMTVVVSSLQSLDLSNFNTINVENMEYMFYGCARLTTLNLSNFNTSKVTNMSNMFNMYCSMISNATLGIKTLDISNFDTSNVTDMTDMFANMKALQEIALGENFSFKGNGSTSCTLPTPNSSYITGADGNWYNKDTGTAYTPANVPSNIVATYTATKPPVAYAVYSATDTSLTFYKTTDTITAGDTYNNKTATAVYTGIESDTYASYSKVPWYTYRTSITTVTVQDEISPISTKYWFYGFTKATTINLTNLDTSKVTTMYRMFYNCSSVTTLDLGNFDTSKVTTMNYMFYNCSQLTTLDLSNFDTSNVTNMTNMFAGTYRLQRITIGENFSFKGNGSTSCTLLSPSSSYIDGATGYWYNLDTGDEYAYTGVPDKVAATYVAIDTRASYAVYSATDKSLTFYKSATPITAGSTYNGKTATAVYTDFETATYASASDIPWKAYISSITKVEVVDAISPVSTKNWFYDASKVTEMNLSKLNTSKVTNMYGMFYGCTSLETLDVSGFKTTKVTDMMYMFGNCASLKTLDISNFSLTNVTNMSGMFYYCPALTKLYTGGIKATNITDLTYMFGYCSSLTSIDLSGFNTSKVTSMMNMFEGMTKLEEIKLGSSFSFNGSESSRLCSLPEQTSSNITGADGKWYNKSTGTAYTPANVPNNTAATYLAVPVYTVTFNANGGQITDLGAATTTRKVIYGKAYNRGSDTIPDAELDGYYFVEWNTKADGTGTTITGTTIVDEAAKNLTLYAIYEEKNLYALYVYEYPTGTVGTYVKTLKFYETEAEPPEAGTSSGRMEIQAVYTDFKNETFTSASDVPWNEYASEIEMVTVETEIFPKSTAYWFSGLTNATSLDVANINTKNVTNMSHMFYEAGTKRTLSVVFEISGLENWDTSNVTDMSYMFYKTAYKSSILDGGISTTGLSTSTATSSIGNIESWDTSNVTDMSYMFYMFNGSSDTVINCSSWDISKVVSHTAFNTKAKNVTAPTWVN